MTRLPLLTVPLGGAIAWAAIATMLSSGDAWLASILIAAAALILLAPVLPPQARGASSAGSDPAELLPVDAAVEADVVPTSRFAA